jgi:hypothetical protein
MKNILLKSLFLLTVIFLILSCRSTDDKIKDFVKEFNVSRTNENTGMYSSVSAEELPNKKIKLTFKSDIMSNKEDENGFTKTFANTFISYLVSNVKEVPTLINEGVEIEIHFVAKDDSEISSATLNKKSMEEVFKKKQEQLLSTKPTENYVESLEVDPSTREVLAIMNKDLPYEDKKNGTTIIKIYINKEKQIVYDVKVTDIFADVLKTDDGRNLIRDGMLRQPQLKGLLDGLSPLGVGEIKYNYMNKSEKTIAEIKLAKKDIL